MRYFILIGLGLCASIVALDVFLQWRRRHRPDPFIEARIVRPTYRYLNADESLETQSRKRREAAELIRRRANRVNGGGPSDLQIVGKRHAS